MKEKLRKSNNMVSEILHCITNTCLRREVASTTATSSIPPSCVDSSVARASLLETSMFHLIQYWVCNETTERHTMEIKEDGEKVKGWEELPVVMLGDRKGWTPSKRWLAEKQKLRQWGRKRERRHRQTTLHDDNMSRSEMQTLLRSSKYKTKTLSKWWF